ncbi:MAG: SLC13 family permease [Fervidicoccaceae archaeon]
MWSPADSYGPWIGLCIVAFLVAALVVRSRAPRVPIWSIMAFTSFISVLSGLVGFDELETVIDLDVILFLIGMFSIIGLADSSGLLEAISLWFIGKFKRRLTLVYGSSLLFGLLSAVAVNDTVALMGPPIALTIARAAGLDPKMMFLLLAFSLTVGSVMTPMGNPQNILIAARSGLDAPFLVFASKLALPTLINLLLVPWVLIKLYGVRDARVELGLIPSEAIKNRRDAALAAVGLISAVCFLVANDVLELRGLPHVERRGIIPFVVASAIYMFSSSPRQLLARVDWGTIVFFIAMFITMEGVWRSGALAPVLGALMSSKETGPEGVLRLAVASLALSQALSNVPFVRLFIAHMRSLGYGGGDAEAWLALAAFSTIAGNLTILGAASNVIVLECLESRMRTTIDFVEFAKRGSIVTAINALVYSAFFAML